MTRRPPTSDGDRALAGRRARTPPAGVAVDPLATTTEELDTSFDSLTPPPVMVEEIRTRLAQRGDLNGRELQLVQMVAEHVVERMAEHAMHAHEISTNRLLAGLKQAPTGENVNRRLAELEAFRDEFRDWRLRLTGVADTNGRIGAIDRSIAKLREDVGTPDECKQVRDTAKSVRSARRWAMAAIGTAAAAIGSVGYNFVKDRDAETRDAARLEFRVEQIEKQFERLQFGRLPSPFRGAAPAPDDTPRSP